MLELPIPAGNIELIWLLIGMNFGRSFGKKLDYEIQQSEWFTRQPVWLQGIIKRILDFTHHWQYGAIIWLYAPLITRLFFWPSIQPEIMWFGIGIFIDDIRDFKHVLDRYKTETEVKPSDG